MKFQLIVEFVLIFYTYDSANFKKHRDNTMKKCYSLYCASPAYYRMYSTDIYYFKQTGSSSTKKAITHHFFVSGIGQRKKTVDAAKFCGGAENVVKTETQQTFVNGLLGFYYFEHLYSAGSAYVCSQ